MTVFARFDNFTEMCDCKPRCHRTEFSVTQSQAALSKHEIRKLTMTKQVPVDLPVITFVQDWAILESSEKHMSQLLSDIDLFMLRLHTEMIKDFTRIAASNKTEQFLSESQSLVNMLYYSIGHILQTMSSSFLLSVTEYETFHIRLSVDILNQQKQAEHLFTFMKTSIDTIIQTIVPSLETQLKNTSEILVACGHIKGYPNYLDSILHTYAKLKPLYNKKVIRKQRQTMTSKDNYFA